MLKRLLCRVSAACVAWLYRSHALECVGRVVVLCTAPKWCDGGVAAAVVGCADVCGGFRVL